MPAPRLSRLSVLRIPWRLALVVAITVASQLVFLAGRLLLARSPRRRRDWPGHAMRMWSRALARALGLRLAITGTAPRAPFLLVSNHLSYVDVLTLGAATGGVFVAKQEIAAWPVAGALCRSIGTVFVDRSAKRDLVRTARSIETALGEGRGVILFPEGTTGDGSQLLPFRPSLLEVAATGGLAVYHAALSYETPAGAPAAAEAVAWVGGIPIVRHALGLIRLPCFTARITFGPKPLHDADRKRLAHRLQQAVAADLGRQDRASQGVEPGPEEPRPG